jgi:DNA repair exonuclease SbcCD nuclease subunit
MKKIIHLSDIHVGHDDCGERFRTIISNILLRMQPPVQYVVVVTGDIVENANHEEYTDEALTALRKLENNGYRVLVVPGNHDYGTGAWGNEKFVPVFKKRFYGDTGITYPKLDIIEDTAFIGLDSTAEELHWRDAIFAEGELGKKQLKRLKKMMAMPEIQGLKKVIYLHHHPFDFQFGRQLKDRDKLEKIITGKVDAILFGHFHNNSATTGKDFHGMWGINRCYNAGSSTRKNGNKGFHRVIDLSNPDHRVDYDADFLKEILLAGD